MFSYQVPMYYPRCSCYFQPEPLPFSYFRSLPQPPRYTWPDLYPTTPRYVVPAVSFTYVTVQQTASPPTFPLIERPSWGFSSAASPDGYTHVTVEEGPQELEARKRPRDAQLHRDAIDAIAAVASAAPITVSGTTSTTATIAQTSEPSIDVTGSFDMLAPEVARAEESAGSPSTLYLVPATSSSCDSMNMAIASSSQTLPVEPRAAFRNSDILPVTVTPTQLEMTTTSGELRVATVDTSSAAIMFEDEPQGPAIDPSVPVEPLAASSDLLQPNAVAPAFELNSNTTHVCTSKKLKVANFDNEVRFFYWEDVPGDGDCGFVATGVTRAEFADCLLRCLEKGPLGGSTDVRALLSESVLGERERLGVPGTYALEQYREAFAAVYGGMNVVPGSSKMFDDPSLNRFVKEIVLFDDGECHPYFASISDLKLVSVMFNRRITVVEAFELEFDELTPENHISYAVVDSVAGGAERDLYLICTAGNHFDKLIPVENVRDGCLCVTPSRS